MCHFRQTYWTNNGLSFALTSRQHVLPCYLRILCLRHNTPYVRWHALHTLPFCKQGLSPRQCDSFRQKTNKNQQNFILNICRCTPVTSYERSNHNLPYRWVLAWLVQKWILWVIVEHWEAVGPSTLRGCRQNNINWGGGVWGGVALTIWSNVTMMLRQFDPPFSGLRKLCIVSTPIF